MDNNGDNRVSEMEHLLKQYRSQLAERQAGEAISGQRNITLPLDILDHLYLEKLADRLGLSKTAVAIDILAVALRDVHHTLFGQGLSEQEITEYHEKLLGRSVARERKEPE
jgi:hypothetical protein